MFYGFGHVEFVEDTAVPVVDPVCYETEIEIKDPPPFAGYDCRCRPWFQQAINNYEKGYIQFKEPYLFTDSNVGVTVTHYFTLEGDEHLPQEGAIGMDFDQSIFNEELS